MPRPEKEYHISICSDRKMVEIEKYSFALSNPGQQGNLKLPPPSVLPRSEEDWEAEATVRQSYDPSVKAKKTSVLRKLEGATPSQRKEFRANERQRLDQLKSVASASNGRSTLMMPPKRMEGDNSGQLRRPTLGGEGWGRDVGVRDSLVAAHMGRGRTKDVQSSRPQLRRPGSFLNSTMDTSSTSINVLGTTMDTTRDTLDQAIDDVHRMTIGRGKKLEAKAAQPLRRPSIGPVGGFKV